MDNEPSFLIITVWSKVDLAASGDSAIANHTKLIAVGTPMKSTMSATKRKRGSPDIAHTIINAATAARHIAEIIAAFRPANA